MKKLITGAALAALVCTPVYAQQETAPPQAAEAQAPDAGMLTLNTGVPITLAVSQEVTSTTHRAGDTLR